MPSGPNLAQRAARWSAEHRRIAIFGWIALVIACVFIGLVFLGTVPFEFDDSDWGLFLISLAGLLISLFTLAVCLLKRRLGHALVGLFIWPFSLYGACRLAKPDSAWAQRFYAERNPDKPRIGVSACLLGDEVRFDGGHKRDAFLADILLFFGPNVV